ncbi:IclR family transcriptional regulator [Saccharopolyspora sp. NPDC049357]|uniref:IclR family transcriptional regulator n=1 Tax=Saccharopolyspora sp. NPDC049357 TaxID=3154507 RepID=UPI003435910F
MSHRCEPTPAWADDAPTGDTAGPRTAVDKAFELLNAFPPGTTTAGVTELAQRTGLTKSTAFRLLAAMERNGFVERDGARYRLGVQLHEIGGRVYEPVPGGMYEALSHVMSYVVEQTGHTAHLGVLRQDEVALLGRLRGPRSNPSTLTMGTRFSAYHSALGKALLAHHLDPADQLMPKSLESELREVRRTGLAFSHGEARPNLSCVAVPLRGNFHRPVAAISVSGHSKHFDHHRYAIVLRSVIAEAERVLQGSVRAQDRGPRPRDPARGYSR